MEPDTQLKGREPLAPDHAISELETASVQPPEPERPYRGLKWIFVGKEGLRAGWSLLVFILIFFLVASGLGAVFAKLHLVGARESFTPRSAFFGELLPVLAMLAAALVVALIERRSILDYNLRGSRRGAHFVNGLAAGFAALSVLVGGLYWGNWLQFGPVALSGAQIIKYAAIWGCVFLLVGLFEEGMMRCYALFTLTRGLNFWWAAAMVGVICIRLLIHSKGNGVWGAYAIALLGVVPCLLLHLKRHPDSGFWQAAWVTSTFFGAGHTGNAGEAWIGIFAAAAIGFVFCVSVKLTGSAWWAIGCHAAWDWGETYFYGTADSGFVAPGHFLTTSAVGNPLWSGGTVGPEGSLLVIGVILLLLALLLLLYGRRPALHPVPAKEQLAS
jgi:membrane protease YdiL (CAAX protease family)